MKKKKTTETVSKKHKPSKNVRVSLLVALALFVITFIFNFLISDVFTEKSGQITNWKFYCAADSQSLENAHSYLQATSDNRISKQFGKPYIHAQYTIPAETEESRLVICTLYSPIRILIDGETVADNGYGIRSFTGNCYNETVISGGEEKQLDIYMYAPLAFDLDAVITSADYSRVDVILPYITIGFSFAVVFLGIALFILALVFGSGQKKLVNLIMLSGTVILCGALMLLLSLTHNISSFTSEGWYCAILFLQLLLFMQMYSTVISFRKEGFRISHAFIAVAVICVIILIFKTAWAIRVAAAVLALFEICIAVKVGALFSGNDLSDFPDLEIIRGLFYFGLLVNLYNLCCLLIGVKMISEIFTPLSIMVFCVVAYVVFCKQAVYSDIKKREREMQKHEDKKRIEIVTELISEMYTKNIVYDFLIDFARRFSTIIDSKGQGLVNSSIALKDELGFSEIYNSGGVKSCDYNALYSHLDKSEAGVMTGNTSVDMLLHHNTHVALIHFENITETDERLGALLHFIYINLQTAYRDISIKNDAKDMQQELFVNLATIVEQKYKETQSHQVSVSVFTYMLCKELGMDEEYSKLVSVASMTHDIGKIAIPDSILSKSGKLSDEEYEIVKKHTVYGYNIMSLQNGKFFEVASKIAEQHHENFDGTGYLGYKGRNIYPAARVVRVADVADALLSERSYKEAWSEERVYNYICDGKGTMFDPAVVDAFVSISESLFSMRKTIVEEQS